MIIFIPRWLLHKTIILQIDQYQLLLITRLDVVFTNRAGRYIAVTKPEKKFMLILQRLKTKNGRKLGLGHLSSAKRHQWGWAMIMISL